MAECFHRQSPRVQTVRPQLNAAEHHLPPTWPLAAVGIRQSLNQPWLNHDRLCRRVNDPAQLRDLWIIRVLLRLENLIHARGLFALVLQDFALERIRAIVRARLSIPARALGKYLVQDAPREFRLRMEREAVVRIVPEIPDLCPIEFARTTGATGILQQVHQSPTFAERGAEGKVHTRFHTTGGDL